MLQLDQQKLPEAWIIILDYINFFFFFTWYVTSPTTYQAKKTTRYNSFFYMQVNNYPVTHIIHHALCVLCMLVCKQGISMHTHKTAV